MKCKDVAEKLLETPNADLVLKVGGHWVEVLSVKPTGEHRNAVTLNVVEEMSPGVPRVIVYSGG